MHTARTPRALETAHRTLWLGLVLTCVGGFLDAFTFVGEGHVFANAMSGNMVLLALSTLSGDGLHAVRALTAIVAFMIGVALADALLLSSTQRFVRWPRLAALLVEAGVLVAIATAPTTVPTDAVILGVTLVAAIQVSMFRQLSEWAFTSTMSTGNLRSLVDAFMEWMSTHRRAESRKLVHFATVCLAFFCGASIGGLATTAWGTHAAGIGAALLIACAILYVRAIRKQPVALDETSVRPTTGRNGVPSFSS